MAPISLFEELPPEDLENVPLLLDRTYERLHAEIERLAMQVKGRISNQEGHLANLNGRMEHQEDCPCQVHREAAHVCPMAAIGEELNKIHRRLAWYAGGLAAAMTLLYLLLNIFRIFKCAN
jgi:hypothetical protein